MTEKDAGFYEIRGDGAMPVVVSVPHGGQDYGPALIARFREPAIRIRLEDRLVDTLALAIAEATGAHTVIASSPRALIDLNRAPDDVDWDMVAGARQPVPRHCAGNRRARSGLGLIPRRLPGYGEIWKDKITADEIERRIETVHRPYHARVQELLEDTRDRWGVALLLDLHSMPPLPVMAGQAAPEYVVGDRFGASCAATLSAAAVRYLGAQGRTAVHNRPYSGGYILERHAAPRRGIHALQVEVCRSAYLDPALSEPGARLPAVARLLGRLVRQLAVQVSALAEGNLRQAAE